MSNWFKNWKTCGADLAGEGAATLDCAKIVFFNFVIALILFAGLTAVTMFIVGGYKFINSAGDPKKFESARHNFTYGLLGLTVVLLSYFIISIISEITNVPCILTFGFGCD